MSDLTQSQDKVARVVKSLLPGLIIGWFIAGHSCRVVSGFRTIDRVAIRFGFCYGMKGRLLSGHWLGVGFSTTHDRYGRLGVVESICLAEQAIPCDGEGANNEHSD